MKKLESKIYIIDANTSKDEINDDLKEVLLKQLPVELRSRWEEASVDQIQGVINERKDLGFETIIGYHCTNDDLEKNDFLLPGDDNKVHYATDIKNLYGKKGKFLYILEGSSNDLDSDSGLGWKTSFARMKIIDKIPLTHEKVEEMGAEFANVA